MFRLLLLILSFNLLSADEISLNYQLMDREIFEHIVVGNTIIGITRQSHSLYMLYFLPEGSCLLWKKNETFAGNWWIEQRASGDSVVRAYWPTYHSSEPASLFFPQNPNYGKATALRYYFNAATGAVILAGKSFQTSVVLAPGRQF
jgi:hypothetical protein